MLKKSTILKFHLKGLYFEAPRNVVYDSHFAEPNWDKEKIKEIIENPSDLSYRPIKPLPNDMMSLKFYDPLLNKFTNLIMVESNKKLARELMAKTFEAIKWKQLKEMQSQKLDLSRNIDEEIEINPLSIFHKAIENAKPLMHLTNVKRGGTTYQVPTPISPNYSEFKALKWIIDAARDKEGKVMFANKLAWELIDASQNKGGVIKKKRDLHSLCEANKAYAHFRWGK